MRTRALSALCAGAVFAVSAAPAAAVVPGTNGRIFCTVRAPASSSGCGIASVKLNRTGYNCVDRFGRDPAVSPDNRRIASVSGDQLVEVYDEAIDGRGLRRLTHAPGEFPSSYSPSFSPDSGSVLFSKYRRRHRRSHGHTHL